MCLSSPQHHQIRRGWERLWQNPASVECCVMCCMLWVVSCVLYVVCPMWMCQKMNVTLSRRSAIWCSAVVSLDTCPRVSTSSCAPGTDRAQHRHTPANFLELELWSFRGPELRSAEGGLVDLNSRADHWRYLELDRASVTLEQQSCGRSVTRQSRRQFSRDIFLSCLSDQPNIACLMIIRGVLHPIFQSYHLKLYY